MSIKVIFSKKKNIQGLFLFLADADCLQIISSACTNDITQPALRRCIYGWLLRQCGHRTTGGGSRSGGEGGALILPLNPSRLVLASRPRRCCQNVPKLGAGSEAEPSISRQTLRETTRTDSQLQGSEKQKKTPSAVVRAVTPTRSLFMTNSHCLGLRHFYQSIDLWGGHMFVACDQHNTGSGGGAAATC